MADSATTPRQSRKTSAEVAPALSADELRKMDAYWRAANYLSVEQIYLFDNPLLKQPLELKHIKPRLLGHWGTTPGLNFLYVHLNRVIKRDNLDMIYIIGPGHGGPAAVANAYLEGTYNEVYPDISQDEAGMKKLFTQFSFPGAYRATSRQRRRVRFMKGASWVIRCRTLTVRHSIIQI
jgi:xylulose-5-phosphate/fructose-6-phosphate phosphoketolase